MVSTELSKNRGEGHGRVTTAGLETNAMYFSLILLVFFSENRKIVCIEEAYVEERFAVRQKEKKVRKLV